MSHPGGGREADAAHERADLLERQSVGLNRADRAAPVDLDERTDGRCLHVREPEEHQSGADRENQEHQHAGGFPGDVKTDEPEAADDESLQDRDEDTERNEQHADSEEKSCAL